MYTIIVYDVEQKRVGKMCKLLRGYLNWIQNSVFEGEITVGKFAELKAKIYKIINEELDSVIIFQMESNKWLKRHVLGKEFNQTDNMV